ncbi:MAG: DNA polymerase II [Candidatus Thermoplasmatota archaeon]|jgi:DNA polymerase I|uniref:DNA-directed DNA polymerase n=1 Tax=Ferroplasma sp. TaxID=2591003 RepID=UPI00262FF094|nr:DNA polymerase domain-containing protein [Ferroplasma sp.]MCL4312337.1 DNA polymerase II [Candidatus Thermoplasmatota archaeon]
MNIKMRIVAASYRQSDVTVELYGRTDDNKSITALYYGFKPYFEYVEPDEECIREIEKNPEYLRMENKKLFLDGGEVNVRRIYIKSPWKVPELRKICQCQALAADIPFHHRFIYDFDLGSTVEIEGENAEEEKKNYTTDLVIKIKTVKKTEDFNPELKIFSFDIENSISTREIFVIGYSIYFDGKIREGSLTGSEPEILKGFNELVQKEDPDIITGYNIDGYDMPLLDERMKFNRLQFSIGRDFISPRRIMDQYWRLHGRVIDDTWWEVRKVLHPKHETLNYVSNMLLNEGKENVNRLDIENEWNKRRDDVIKYCIKDAKLALLIYRKIRILDRNLYLSTVSMLPLDDVTNGGTSTYVDSLLIRRADRENIGVPMSSSKFSNDTYAGGYVHTMDPGLYDMIVVLDFKSMYPSMIIKYNICFTTLSPEGTIIAPNGARFLSPDVKKGLIPDLLEQLMKKRDEVKKQMKEDKANYEYFDGLQAAIKVLMNTFYGVLGTSFYRFTNRDISSAITAFARNTIKSIIEDLEKSGNKVIYGDTDSIFIESGKDTLDEAIEFGNKLSSEISEREKLILEFEKIMDPLFSHGAKKRYAGKIVYPPSSAGEILVRGYETRRTDSFDLQSEALSRVFDLILSRDVDGAKGYAESLIKEVATGKIDTSKLVISRSVKNFSEYKNASSMANVNAAKKLIDRGEIFIPGMKVSWIVTDASKTPQGVEPFIDGREFTYTPDYVYYSKRLQETLNRVLESLDKEVAVFKNPQSKITDAFNENPKKRNIEDFFK